MIQVLPAAKTFGGEFAKAFGSGAGSGFSSAINNIQDEKRDIRKMQEGSRLKTEEQAAKLRGESDEDQTNYKTVKERFGENFAKLWNAAPEGGKTQMLTAALDAVQRGDTLSGLLDVSQPNMNNNDIPTESPKKPPGITPKEWAKQKSTQLYDINKPILKEAGDLRKNIAIQEQAIEDIMESAPDVGIRDWMADYFGFEPLRSESGAKFKTAVKEFFLSDIPRVGVRPNQWVEKQLMDALPVAGRSPISNMITTAGLKFKKDLSKKRLEIIDELSDKYGYSEIDLDKTANKMMKSYVIERQNLLKKEIEDIKNRENNLSGRKIDVIGPDGEEYEVDESEVEILPDGFLIK